MSEEPELYTNYRALTAERSTAVHSGRRLKVTVLRVAVVLAVVLIVAYVFDGVALFFQAKDCAKGLQTSTNLSTEANATLTNNTAPTRKSMTPCGDDWELHGTKCYYFSRIYIRLPWNESRARCQRLKGDLVKIESREEQIFLDAKLQRLMFDDWDKFWIGLTDSESEGHWVWTDGSALNTSLAFWTDDKNNKEPDDWTEEDPEGEDCVRMGRKPNMGGLNWYDYSCKLKLRHICEEKKTRDFLMFKYSKVPDVWQNKSVGPLNIL